MASSSMRQSVWTAQENKKFEKALAKHDRDTTDRWHNVAREVGGGKTADECKRHYDLLLSDLNEIECGRVAIPNYRTTNFKDEQRLMKYLKLQ